MVRSGLGCPVVVASSSFLPHSTIWIAPDPGDLWFFPVLFVTGALLQVAAIRQKKKAALIAGAALVLGAALVDRDPVLGIGQIFVAALFFAEMT